jgi:hypothetical protein
VPRISANQTLVNTHQLTHARTHTHAPTHTPTHTHMHVHTHDAHAGTQAHTQTHAHTHKKVSNQKLVLIASKEKKIFIALCIETEIGIKS